MGKQLWFPDGYSEQPPDHFHFTGSEVLVFSSCPVRRFYMDYVHIIHKFCFAKFTVVIDPAGQNRIDIRCYVLQRVRRLFQHLPFAHLLIHRPHRFATCRGQPVGEPFSPLAILSQSGFEGVTKEVERCPRTSSLPPVAVLAMDESVSFPDAAPVYMPLFVRLAQLKPDRFAHISAMDDRLIGVTLEPTLRALLFQLLIHVIMQV